MTNHERAQLEFAAKTNAPLRKLLEEHEAAKTALATSVTRDIERCVTILELASIAEEFATVGVDVAKKRRVVALRKTAEP